MTEAQSGSTGRVQVARLVEASSETVFSIVGTPSGLSEWMGGEAEFEAVADSPFSVRFPQFATVVSGRVVEVVDDERIVLTWGISEGPQSTTFPGGSSTVRIELAPSGDGTRVTITQSDLPSAEEINQHEAGWKFHLSRLQLLANQRQLARPLEESLSAWCSAWSAPEASHRTQFLELCCTDDVRYADDYAAFEGRATLAAHIAGTLHHVKYTTLRVTGPAQICRGEVLLRWCGEREDGSVAFRGTLYARVGTDGRFHKATSFWEHVELG